jgi:hypothetical protein
MSARFLIPQSGITAQPVSAFLKGRAMKMAYESDRLENEYRQMQMEELPKQAEFNRQLQVAEFQQQQQEFQAEQQATRAKGLYTALIDATRSDDVLRAVNVISGGLGGPPVQGMAPEQARAEAQKMATGLAVQYGFEPPKDPNAMTAYQQATLKNADDREQLDRDRMLAADRRASVKAAAGTQPKPLTAADRRENRMAEEAALKRRNNVQKNISALRTSLDDAATVLDMGKRAIEQSNKFNTGVAAIAPGYKNLPNVTNLRETLDTINAVTGFEELKQMRFESPTGGALGQVAVQEIKFLQKTIASLAQDQGEGQLDANLQIITDRYNRLKETVEKAIAAEEAYLNEQEAVELDDLVSQYAD